MSATLGCPPAKAHMQTWEKNGSRHFIPILTLMVPVLFKNSMNNFQPDDISISKRNKN